ncbi:hypothetical protein AC578_8417 [Pseudocercospora eumusae]|uniref:Uncharacterized protein n=1 Tax=Pseudocercospora eumusae TaxID=321146 RepID=A0A139HRW5_9PEZI|nr:hypothetical protein AC578_8417 [Pseudocercospora eumusae]
MSGAISIELLGKDIVEKVIAEVEQKIELVSKRAQDRSWQTGSRKAAVAPREAGESLAPGICLGKFSELAEEPDGCKLSFRITSEAPPDSTTP